MNIQNIKTEQVQFLRNNNIFTISQRGVTTSTESASIVSQGSIVMIATQVKNIRSITIDASPLVYGTDYTVSYPTKTITITTITFTVNQTGDYIITFDSGPDKIFPDFPRDDLTLNSYPRLAVDLLSAPIESFGIGGSDFISNVAMTIVVYDDNTNDLDGYIQTMKDLYQTNAKNFFYLSFVKPTLIGPTINSPDKKDEIMQKNLDILGMFNVDTII